MTNYNKLWAALIGAGASIAVLVFAVPAETVGELSEKFIVLGGAAIAVLFGPANAE